MFRTTKKRLRYCPQQLQTCISSGCQNATAKRFVFLVVVFPITRCSTECSPRLPATINHGSAMLRRQNPSKNGNSMYAWGVEDSYPDPGYHKITFNQTLGQYTTMIYTMLITIYRHNINVRKRTAASHTWMPAFKPRIVIIIIIINIIIITISIIIYLRFKRYAFIWFYLMPEVRGSLRWQVWWQVRWRWQLDMAMWVAVSVAMKRWWQV